MNRTPRNESSNPISRAFSRFFERGKVGEKDSADTKRGDAPTAPRQMTPRAATASTPARASTPPSAPRTAATPGTPGTPGFAGTTAGTVGSPNAQRASAAVSTVAATPMATPTATLRTHTVQKGDTLSAISEEVYGRADRWQTIFQANRDKLDDPDRIFPGQVLVIPDAPSVH